MVVHGLKVPHLHVTNFHPDRNYSGFGFITMRDNAVMVNNGIVLERFECKAVYAVYGHRNEFLFHGYLCLFITCLCVKYQFYHIDTVC